MTDKILDIELFELLRFIFESLAVCTPITKLQPFSADGKENET